LEKYTWRRVRKRRRVKYFDAFAGIGGFTLPLAERGHACVGFSEIDVDALRIYRRHFPSHRSYGDITQIDADSLPDFDLLVGGFPCQAFSIAGKRRGFSDTRGTLFFELARILRAKRPDRFVFENVKGLLSHDNGRTLKIILAALAKLGYDVQWQMLNSRHFGVPQNRERIFLVGHSRRTPGPEVFPFNEGDNCFVAQSRIGHSCPDSRAREGPPARLSLNELSRPPTEGADRDRIDSVNAGKVSAVSNRGQVVAVAVRGRSNGASLEARCDDVANALRTASGGSSQGLIAYRGHRVNEPDGVSRTLKAGVHGVPGGDGLVRDGSLIRRLTPIECERLQGFPDGWTTFGVDEPSRIWPISDTQRYKCLGNAVTVNVARAIIDRLAN
jgi:DNA (cytosine-5)-methyltransferase 1